MVAIESIVGKLRYVTVHSSLAGQRVDVAGIIRAVGTLKLFQQSLEQRQAAIGQVDGTQLGVSDARLCIRLLHDGGQLLVVTNKHKLVDGTVVTVGSTQQSDEVRLQYL